ncbi:helicase, partial [bacterium]|nr:helicase [bacterium]
MSYQEFISKKLKMPFEPGITVDDKDLNPKLFTFQKAIVKWALHKAKSALFEGCGLGKTLQQLEWAQHVSQKGRVLLLAPLAVSAQTMREADKFGISGVEISKDGNFKKDIIITNYEKLHYFNQEDFAGIVIDESSILKNYSGSTRQQITDFAQGMKYRLACTATP